MAESCISVFSPHGALRWLRQYGKSVDMPALGMNPKPSLGPDSFVPDLIDVKEAARLLKVTEKTIYRRIENGQMPHRRFGPRLIRFTRDDILGSLARRASRSEILG